MCVVCLKILQTPISFHDSTKTKISKNKTCLETVVLKPSFNELTISLKLWTEFTMSLATKKTDWIFFVFTRHPDLPNQRIESMFFSPVTVLETLAVDQHHIYGDTHGGLTRRHLERGRDGHVGNVDVSTEQSMLPWWAIPGWWFLWNIYGISVVISMEYL